MSDPSRTAAPSRRGRAARLLAAILATSTLVAGPMVAAPAYADDYPSWQDVQNAQGDEQATQDEIAKVNDALAGTQQKAADASTAAMKAAQASDAARADADAAAKRADQLTAQAADATAAAERTHEQVGTIIAGRARTETAAPLSVRLLTASDPDQLLTRLGVMQRLDATWSTLGARALAEQGVAATLRDQAQTARTARDQRATAAEQAAREAKAAADAEAAAVQDLQGHVTTLYQQLAALKNTTADVERRYRLGQQVAEQERQAELQREAAAAAAAAGSGGGSSGGSGGGSTDLGGGGVNVDPAGAQAYAAGQLGNYGWGQDQFPCLYRLWMQESSWRADALNPDSDAYGIPQALPAEKLAAAGPDWRTNGNTQIDWGLNYIQDRYGSPCGAWAHEVSNNWY
ncbi:MULTISPECIES: hypothetical protein [unclassified Microbacterium]|uniref:aggregation-promoting factor C-terminal-like domain-containing protein n=1 Tax=unclassified Microbacterium TaxID=2609290 RepID=UPI001AD33FBF|nr:MULTISPECIES: hypothetical protein [unclassified Microbacterium]MBN9156100.1 hypothetical protein [Microbacterium sp.]MBS1901001.1 hypothetical protein [Actinomycetota bacterium]